jgi:hypothetical protein
MQMNYSLPNPNTNQVVQAPSNTNQFMGLSRRIYTYSLAIPKQVSPKTTSTQSLKEIIANSASLSALTPQQQELKKMIWGEPTWFLFHTLAEKVHDEGFIEIRTQLLELIYTISVNLPCPTCSEHSKQYMEKNNFKAIQTKEQLKMILFDFHNSVNARKSYPIFSYSDLGVKYSHAITLNIVQNFMRHYEKKSKSIRLIADELHRERIISSLKQWFNENIGRFAP